MLFGALQTAKAWEMLHDPNVGGKLNADQFLELCKEAGYSEEQAQKAATRRANQRLDQGLPQ